MLCALNLDRETHLPPDRMGIYQAAVDMLLHRRDQERNVHSTMPDMSVRERLQLLQDLAWGVSANSRSELTRADALGYITRRLEGMPRITAGAEAVLTHLIERSGVLREPAAGRVDFVHRTFQEYLAAREAADQNSGGMLARHYAHLDTWREIVIMAAGHASRPMRTELISRILERAHREPQHRRVLILLAAACLETMPSLEPPELLAEVNSALDGLLPPRSRTEAQRLHSVGEPLLNRLPTDLTHLSTGRASAVVRTVALVNGPRALQLLEGYAADPRPRVQRQLIESWSYFDPEEYAERVLAEAPLDSGSIRISQPALLAATRHLRHLTAVDLDVWTRVDLDELAPCAQLRTYNGFGASEGALALLNKFPNLETLYFSASEARQFTTADFAALAELPKLTHLTLFGQACDDAALHELSRSASLRELLLYLKDEVTDISPLAQLRQLSSLDITSGQVQSYRAFASLPIKNLAVGPPHRPPRRGPGELVTGFPYAESVEFFFGKWPRKLDFLDGFGSLRTLRLFEASQTWLNTISAPPTLRKVRIFNTEVPDLTPLAKLTQLTELDLDSVRGHLDLACFAGWHEGTLQITLDRDVEPTGTEGLPSSIRLRRH